MKHRSKTQKNKHYSNTPAVFSASGPSVAVCLKKIQSALILHQKGCLSDAEVIYKEVLRIEPYNFDALHLLAAIALQRKQFTEAVHLFERALNISSSTPNPLNNYGLTLSGLHRYEEAVVVYDKVIALKPDFGEAFFNRANALLQLQRFEEAILSYDNAVLHRPNFAQAYYNRANALHNVERFEEAIQSYEKAIMLKPDFVEAYYNCGNVFHKVKRFEEAIAKYEKVIVLQPSYAEAYANHGLSLYELKRYPQALLSYERAKAINPDFVDAWSNSGLALYELHRYDEAIQSYNKAIALNPRYGDAYYNRGNAYLELQRYEEGISSYDKAIELNANVVKSYYNIGNAFRELKQYEDSILNYEKAIALSPNGFYLLGECLHTKMQICSWSSFDNYVHQLIEQIECHEKATTPFPFFAMLDSLLLQKTVAVIYASDKHASTVALPQIPHRAKGSKIRIGYFSADFRNHAVSYLMVELFERHNKDGFEIYAFSYGPNIHDDMRHRLEPVFTKFIDVRTLTDKDIVMLSRSLDIDIAVDLGGYTKDSRTGLFALRAAPIQVSYLGFPGTMGACHSDYLIADHILIPDYNQQFYTEKIAYLPNSYMVNSKRSIADKVMHREDYGLPENGFVFCCFNNNYKITPATFDGWMRILKQVQGSVLWLFEDNAKAAFNLLGK